MGWVSRVNSSARPPSHSPKVPKLWAEGSFSQGFCGGIVSVVASFFGNDMSVHMLVAIGNRHGLISGPGLGLTCEWVL